MSDIEPIRLVPRTARSRAAAVHPIGHDASSAQAATSTQVSFDRNELTHILNLYGRMVAAGEWRDYALGFFKDQAVFAVFRRASEAPLYRIEKTPRLARRQGAYAVVTATGHILKRGHDLGRVLAVLDKSTLRLVTG